MRRTRVVLVVVCLLVVGLTPAAQAQSDEPPAGAISDNVEFLGNLPELRTAVSLNFIGDVMFVSTFTGLHSYDVSDPAAPRRLGILPMYLHQNEDVDVDPVRNLVFLSRDPRGAPGVPSGTFPYGAVHIVDVSNPALMTLAGTFTLPAGHTSTCINDCDFLWTGGPIANAQTQPGWSGRPIFGTDVTDPLNPVPCPEPIDVGRNDGTTDYAHDVQVDDMGIAWVSGAGGIRGYWTDGEHRDPLTGEVRTATACDPVPYAGGGTPSEATPSRFMHNSWRPLDAQIPGDDASRGMILYGTEENVVSNCATSGRFATYDLRGSFDGEGWRDIAETQFRLTALDSWWPEQQEGSTGCASAHYFDDRGDGLLAYAFYGQGTRFLDVSDPRDIRQVGYFRPDGGSAWAAYWFSDIVYITDSSRGVDIVRFSDAPAGADLTAPALTAPPPEVAMDPAFGYLCVL